MALTTRLVMRQGQSLVMTPQLLQAIRLLQFSHVELAAFVQEELDRNPLLERSEEPSIVDKTAAIDTFNETLAADRPDNDWAIDRLATDAKTLERDLGTEVGNAFDTGTPGNAPPARDDQGVSATAWSGGSGKWGARRRRAQSRSLYRDTGNVARPPRRATGDCLPQRP